MSKWHVLLCVCLLIGAPATGSVSASADSASTVPSLASSTGDRTQPSLPSSEVAQSGTSTPTPTETPTPTPSLPDEDPPQLNNVSIINDSVASGDTLIVALNASDASRIVDIEVNLRRQNIPFGFEGGESELTLSRFDRSGFNQDSITLQTTVPNRLVNGTYSDIDIEITDAEGNTEDFFPSTNVDVSNPSVDPETSPPELEDATIVNDTIEPGQRLVIRVTASDQSQITEMSVDLDKDFTDLPFEYNTQIRLAAETDSITQNGTTRLSTMIPESQVSGDYRLDDIDIEDNIGNRESIFEFNQTESVKIVDGLSPTDQTPPQVQDVTVRNESVQPGDELLIELGVEDDSPVVSARAELDLQSDSPDRRFDDSRITIEKQRASGLGDTVRLRTTIPQGQFNGTYELNDFNIDVKDAALNEGSPEGDFKKLVTVRSASEVSDIDGPRISNITVLNKTVQAGDRILVTADVTDASGIESVQASYFIETIPPGIEIGQEGEQAGASESRIGFTLRDKKSQSIENGSVKLTTTVPADILSGRYRLQNVESTDTVGNQEFVSQISPLTQVQVEGTDPETITQNSPEIINVSVLNNSVEPGSAVSLRVETANDSQISNISAFFEPVIQQRQPGVLPELERSATTDIESSLSTPATVSVDLPESTLNGTVRLESLEATTPENEFIFFDPLNTAPIKIGASDSSSPTPVQVDVNVSALPGDGSTSNPYEIANASELQAMEDDLDANYALVSDIDASQTAQFNNGSGFDPVGPSFSANFTGSLDGKSHTITGLTISRTSEDNVGLFGVSSGTLANITLTNVTVNGNAGVGGLAGINNDGEIRNIRFSGSVNSTRAVGGLIGVNTGSITTARVSGSVTGIENVGGLVGDNDGGTIRVATASVSVTASGDAGSAGGLVGFNGGAIQNTSAFGSVQTTFDGGGLVGTQAGSIRDSFAAGAVTATTDDASVGGLIGFNDGIFIQDSYFDQRATNQSVAATNPSNLPPGLNLTTAQMQGQAAPNNMSGFDFDTTWTTTSEYPALRALSETSENAGSGPIQVDIDPSDLPGDGSSSSPYEIANVSELQAMEDDLDANYELVSDIDASQTAQFDDSNGFDPVGEFGDQFTGSFDGDNHTVTGLTINRPNENGVGLFGVTGSDATLTNVALANVTVSGNRDVGGLVGINFDGRITTATASGSVNGTEQVGGLVGDNSGDVTSVTASGSVTGEDDVGGLVGLSDGTIMNVTASGSVNGTDSVGGLVGFNTGNVTNATSSGSVTGEFDVGGLVGRNDGAIQNVTASNDVVGSPAGGLIGRNDGTIQNATASGSVNATERFASAGGLVGDNSGNITDATASGSVNTTEDFASAGGLVGSNLDRGYIADATASGSVTGSSVSPDVGGLVGFNGGLIQNASASGGVTGTNQVGGLVGENFGNVTNATASGSVTGEFDVGGLVGDNRDRGTITDSSASGSVTGTIPVGGLVGFNNGSITTAIAAGNVIGQEDTGGLVGVNRGNITNVTASGKVNGREGAGGLVGDNFGNIADATASGKVNGGDDLGGLVGLNGGTVTNATASGSVTGDDSVGGLVGTNIIRFVLDGNESVRAGTIQDTFAVGGVSGDLDVGGLVGNNSAPGTTTTGTVEQSYFDEQATGQTTSAGNATGLTTAQMQGQAAAENMSGFDFETTWTTTSEYPALRALSNISGSTPDSPPDITIQHGGSGGAQGGSGFISEDIRIESQPAFQLTPENSLQIQNSTGSTVTVTPTESVSNVTDIEFGSSLYDSDGTIDSESSQLGVSGENASGFFSTQLNITLSGDTEMFAAGVPDTDAPPAPEERSDPFDTYTVTLVANGDIVDSTDERLIGIGYNEGDGLRQNSTRGNIRFTLPRASLNQGVNESWTASFELRNETGVVLTKDITEANQGDEFNFTIDTSELDSGNYTFDLTLSVDGNPGLNERIMSIFGVRDVTIESDTSVDRELVIQPPSQIVRGEPFAVEVLNASGAAVSEATVTLEFGPNTNLANQTATTNATGIAVFEMPTAATTTTEAVTLVVSPDANQFPPNATGDQLTITGIRDPGDLQVENLSVAPEELPQNNPVTVTAEITNTNETSLNQTLRLTADQTRLTTAVVTIPGETTRTVTLTEQVTTLGTQTLNLNGQSAGTVTVVESTPPTPELAIPQVGDTSLPGSVNATTDANVTVPLTNVGDEFGEFTLRLTIDDDDGGVVRTRTVELAATETRSVTFADVTGELPPQTTPYTLTAIVTASPATTNITRNASLTTNLSIAPSGDGSLQITEVRAPARVSDGDQFTVSARIGNFGANLTTDELTLAIDTDRDGSFSDETETITTRQQTLPANETARVAFQATATSGTEEQQDLSFRLTTDGDTVSGNVSVVSTEFTTAVSTGDPHIVSFDGVAYDFHAAGEFVLAREPTATTNGTLSGTDSLIVQARQEPLAGSDSITQNTAVATVVDNQTVIIDVTDTIPLQINGSRVGLTRSETVAVGNGTITRSGNSLTITYPGEDNEATIGDEHLTVDLYSNRVDIELNLDPQRDRPVEGVFGPADGNTTNDIGLPNGTALAQPPQAEQLYGVFGESWRVNNSTTLFAYEGENGPETYYDPTIPAGAVSLADLDVTERQEAEQRAIDAGLQPGTVAFRNAVLDLVITGDGSYLISAQQQNTSAETTRSVGAPREPTVRVESSSLGPGGTTELNLTLEQASDGLAGYNLTAEVVGVTDSGVRVVEASAPTVFNDSVTETTIGPDNQTVEIRATDITEVVEANDTEISLGEVTVAADETTEVSEVAVTVTIERVDDDSGSPIEVETQNGTISVTEQAPFAENLNPPTDPDNDGVFEDVNGNGRVDFNDVVVLFENLPDAEVPFQDVNGNGRIDFDDIVELFQEI